MSSGRTPGLGRGLDALIPSATAERGGLRTVPLSAIEPNPKQPRDSFDQQMLAELAQSLQTVGLLQPIVVREQVPDRYQIIAGERRYRAAELAGFTEIPVLIRHTEDDQLLTEALVENIHRVNLNALEEAAAYHQLIEDFDFTHEQLAARLGRSRSTITNTLRLLGLDPDLQRQLATGALSPGHARALLSVDDADVRRRVANEVVDGGLSVRATEQLIRRATATPPPATAPPSDDVQPAYGGLQRQLSDAFATKVRITGSADRGQVVIDFSGRDDLQRVLTMLEGGVGAGVAREPA